MEQVLHRTPYQDKHECPKWFGKYHVWPRLLTICLHVEIVSLGFHCTLKHYHCNNLLKESIQWYVSSDGKIDKLIYI